MTDEATKGLVARVPRKWVLAVGICALFATSLKLIIAATTYGTTDVYTWTNFGGYIDRFGAIALYARVWIFIHPPFMVHMLRFWGWLSDNTGVPFGFWLRLPGILADVGSLVLTFKLLEREGRASPPALLLLALAPASIMISGFHGNTDPVMVFFVLLSIYLIETGESLWMAGFALGMSLNTKAAAGIFVPVIVLYLPSLRQRVQLIAAACLTFLIASMPYIFQIPVLIFTRISAYSSVPGHWGVTRFLHLLPSNLSWADLGYARWGRFVLLAIILSISVYLNKQRSRPPLFLQCGVIVFLFMSITPGFGIHYLAWLVPFAALDLLTAVVFYTTSGVFLFLAYNHWAGGLPWYFADQIFRGDWTGWAIAFEISCWLVALAVLVRFLWKVRSHWSQVRPRTPDLGAPVVPVVPA